jgi:NADH:ubiquinone oxidoreductase subunit
MTMCYEPLPTDIFKNVLTYSTDAPQNSSIGFMEYIYNSDQSVSLFRHTNNLAKVAEVLRPNYPYVWQHWIYHVLNTDPKDWDYSGLHWYKQSFPWNAESIDKLTDYFLKTVPLPEQLEILSNASDLAEIMKEAAVILSI